MENMENEGDHDLYAAKPIIVCNEENLGNVLHADNVKKDENCPVRKRGRRCLVLACKNIYGESGKTFHALPRDLKLGMRWLTLINRTDLLPNVEESYKAQRRICSDHFAESAYIKQGRVLKKDATPTMNLEADEQMEWNESEYNAILTHISKEKAKRQYRHRDKQKKNQVRPASNSISTATVVTEVPADKKIIYPIPTNFPRKVPTDKKLPSSYGRKCLVRSCKNYTKSKDVKFHSLPKNVALAKVWLHRIERKDLIPKLESSINANRQVCENHFSKSAYIRPGSKYLKKYSLPSLNSAVNILELLMEEDANSEGKQCSDNGLDSNGQLIPILSLNECESILSGTMPANELKSNQILYRSQKCLVRDCNKSTLEGEHRFYKLPKDVTTASCWLEAIKRMDLLDQVSELIRTEESICSDHFPPSAIYGKRYSYLKKTATPSLNPADFIKKKFVDNSSDDQSQEADEIIEIFPQTDKRGVRTVYRCIAFNCKRRLEGIKYHCLPRIAHLAKKWLIALNRTDLLPELKRIIKARKKVCGLHFPPTCYENEKYLKRNAVPVLLPVYEIKVDNLIQSDKENIKFHLYDIPLQGSQQTAEKIRFDIDLLSQIESEGNCIPFNVAKQHIVWGLNYFKTKNNKPKILDAMDTFCPILYAMHDISLLEVLHNLFLINECGCKQIIIAYDPRRSKFIHALFCEILDCSINILSNVDKMEGYFKDNMKLDVPYCSMFVFDTTDLENVIHCIVSIFHDPIIPWRVKYVYAHTNCYSELYTKLKEKLCPFQNVLECEKNSSDPKLIEAMNQKFLYETITPTTCATCDKERYFDTDLNLSSTIILKKFDSIGEAMEQSKTEKGGLGSVWCRNISFAYNVAQKLKYNTVWINCLGMLNSNVPFQLREGMNCLGSDFAFVDFLASFFPTHRRTFSEFKKTPFYDMMKNGLKVDHSFRFQYETIKIKADRRKNRWVGMENTLIYGQSRLQFDELIDLSDDYWGGICDILNKCKLKTIILPCGKCL